MGCENEEDDPYAVKLVHALILPFAPVEGMWFTDGDWTDLATLVDWDNQSQEFHVSTPKDDEIEEANMLGKDHRPLRVIVAEYVEKGWNIEEGKRGKAGAIGEGNKNGEKE
jgi:hypothetical protein